MLHDPVREPLHGEVTSVSIPWPPLSGPGSDKETWVAFAREVAKGNEEAWEVVDEQAARIASLEAEVAQLRVQLTDHEPVSPELVEGGSTEDTSADAKPSASRRRTSEDTRAAIRADLAAGRSQREAATRNGVSVMTVSRVARGI